MPEDYPMWGKAKIAVLLRRHGHAVWDLPNDDLDDINRWIDAFADAFNTFRPHQALDGHPPAEYLARHTAEDPPPSHML